MKPTLYLFPNLLDENGSVEAFLPASVATAVSTIDGIIAESEKGARKFLRRFSFPEPKTFRDIPIQLLNEHTQVKQLDELLSPIVKGETWGLVSDCGLPCLADPGSNLVYKARQRGITIETFAGPSSVIYALMLSGLGAQHFTFHGYLAKDEAKRSAQLKTIETRSREDQSTHLCIEAPYRNQKLLTYLLQNLKPETTLCVATDLTLPTQWVMTQTVGSWRKQTLPEIDQRPTVFVFRAN
jgi:16S rRNA (cytidine1402-2'-O)-methyltransferase